MDIIDAIDMSGLHAMGIELGPVKGAILVDIGNYLSQALRLDIPQLLRTHTFPLLIPYHD
jgi:hypothetical protein